MVDWATTKTTIKRPYLYAPFCAISMYVFFTFKSRVFTPCTLIPTCVFFGCVLSIRPLELAVDQTRVCDLTLVNKLQNAGWKLNERTVHGGTLSLPNLSFDIGIVFKRFWQFVGSMGSTLFGRRHESLVEQNQLQGKDA